MKLYNIYETVILEEIEKSRNLLVEGVSDSDVIAAINGKYNVNITYEDDVNSAPSKRYIQVYAKGVTAPRNTKGETSAGNRAIRAYQIAGGSKTGSAKWKIFRLDKIKSWTATKMKWVHPVSDFATDIPAYNQLGDKSFEPDVINVDASTFTRQRSDIAQRPKLGDNNEEI